ncbi:helix-turn-helix transcriptional regulator [Agromyces bauzanensis]|uniref:ArsR family transcriptional regulator n=1 Tax=Agromyces bauzanensis TaxID=1308924 RepID=A0A917PFZ8_9MICO|nr:transcriptional regulator [Agromyces bauzanensis]GGJ75302.1 ArsR family transcriptional regulator [Agromyces bauzanensis]
MASDDGVSFEQRLSAVSALADPLRRRAYEVVARSLEPLGHDAVATTLGIPRSTAAFHLNRLAAEGLLDVEFRRLGERIGPGQGRPAKVYRRTDADLAVQLPRRLYEVAGRIMAGAIADAADGEAPVMDSMRVVAATTGARLAGASADLDEALARLGMEPMADGPDLVLGTCPFHGLARENPAIVCALNHALVCGMAQAVGDDPDRVRLDPGAGRCCVRIGPPTPVQRVPS